MICFDSKYAAHVVQQSWQAKSHMEVVRYAGELHRRCDLHAEVRWHWVRGQSRIWEMKLLTLWPRLELGGSGTSGKNANHVIWKACSACVRGTCCFGGWLQSLLSTLLQLDVRSQSLCGPWFASLSTFLSSWCSVAVSPNPWNDVHFVLRVTATQPLIVFFENMFLSAAELFLVVFLVPARVLATLPCSSRRLCGILGCVHRRFPSLVILQRFEILLIVLRIKLDLVCALV